MSEVPLIGGFEAGDAPDFCQYADGYDVGDTRVHPKPGSGVLRDQMCKYIPP